MIDKPCFGYDRVYNCLIEEIQGCIRGDSWDTCNYGKCSEKYNLYVVGPSDFAKKVKDRHKKRINQAKHKKAVEIREEIDSWLKNNGYYWPFSKGEKGELTKIIKKHL